MHAGHSSDLNRFGDMSTSTAENSYDLVPYKSSSFVQSHPDRLATIATLFGLRPPPLDNANILELGCASGGNLIPIADQLPLAYFIGVDASERQIADGQAVITRCGLANIELRPCDFRTFSSDRQFDYIICHGVFSGSLTTYRSVFWTFSLDNWRQMELATSVTTRSQAAKPNVSTIDRLSCQPPAPRRPCPKSVGEHARRIVGRAESGFRRS